MKRLHVSVSVQDLDQSVRFYSAMFAAEPTVVKDDYAKWMLDDPRVNFVVDCRGTRPGVDHLGIQVENEDELQQVYERFQDAEGPVSEVAEGTCCYAKSQKSWTADPQGVPWEAFHTTDLEQDYGTDVRLPEIVEKWERERVGCC